MYMQLKHKHVRVHTFGGVIKIVYDASLGILVFQNANCLYVSALNSGMTV